MSRQSNTTNQRRLFPGGLPNEKKHSVNKWTRAVSVGSASESIGGSIHGFHGQGPSPTVGAQIQLILPLQTILLVSQLSSEGQGRGVRSLQHVLSPWWMRCGWPQPRLQVLAPLSPASTLDKCCSSVLWIHIVTGCEILPAVHQCPTQPQVPQLEKRSPLAWMVNGRTNVSQ